MKKFLSILLAVLVLGACATVTVDAKKKSSKKKARTTKVVKRDLVRTYCKTVEFSNVRSGPSMDCPVVETLQKGHVVFVVQQEGEWYYINMYPGQEIEGTQCGWTHRKNLRYHAPDDGVN